MTDKNVRVAWNAAYWLLRSEARRQFESKHPDCDWKMVEANDECVATIIEAQARICMDAMQGLNPSHADSASTVSVKTFAP